MKSKACLSIAFAMAILLPQVAHAGVAEDAMQRERELAAPACSDVEFLPQAIWTGDINNDGDDDVIVWTSAMGCDRQIGAACNDFGCPVRLYVQRDDASLAYVTQVRAFSYELRYRYGVRVIDFRIGGKRCQKVGKTRCSLIGKVDGLDFMVLSTE